MDEISQRYDLRTIELEHKPLFDQAFRTVNTPISDYTFANTFIWKTVLKLYWQIIEGHLCVFSHGTNELSMLIPPIGEGDLSTCFKACFDLMDEYNSRLPHRPRSVVECVSDELLDRFSSLRFDVAPMGCDYIYDTDKMIHLPGGDLKSKRQAKTKFAREHQIDTRPLTPDLLDDCLALLATWQLRADQTNLDVDHAQVKAEVSALRAKDTAATRLALLHADAIGLVGMTLFADGKLVGFTMGEPLTQTQSAIVVEKTDRSLPGSAQYIFSEFCRQYLSYFPECNVGDAWGLPSLQWTKESYRPKRLLSKFSLTAIPATVVGWHRTPVASSVRLGDGYREQVAIELAVPQDLDALSALESRVFGHELAINRRRIKALLVSERARVLVAKDRGTIVGWAIVLLRRHRMRQSARLYSLAVDEAYRGQKIGHRLVEHVLGLIEALDIKRCFLEVAENNVTAMHLYERFGFVVQKTLPNYYGADQHAFRMLRVGKELSLIGADLPRPIGVV